MPTKRPRHTVTEVGPVEDALEEVRRLGIDPDPKDLVVRGARQLVAEVTQAHADDERRRELQERLIRRTTNPGGFDADALLWAHEESWARNSPRG